MNKLFDESPIEIYQSIIQNNPDAIFILSTDGRFVEVNRIATEMFGKVKGDVLGRSYTELTSPEHVEKVNRYFDDALKGLPSEYETDAVDKNGSTLHLLVKFIPLVVREKVVGVFCVVKDITELRQTKASLNHMEERYKALFNSTGDAVHVLDLDGNMIDVNPAFEEIYGWKREEIVEKPLPIIPQDRLAEVQSLLERVINGEYIKGYETTCIRKDGSLITISLTLSPIQDDKGKIVAISGITRDTTSQKALERSLKESRERYKSLFEHNFNPTYSMDLYGRFIDGNSMFERVTGYSVMELCGVSFEQLVVPDYLESTKEKFLKATQGEAQLYECAIYNKQGEVIPLMVTNVPIIVNDQVVGVFGMAQDLTESKKAEKALKESEERYRKVVELSPKGIVIHREGKILYANRAARKIVKDANPIGQSIFSYIHPDYHELYKQRVSEVEIGGDLPFIEFELIGKDGTVIDAEVGGALLVYDGSPATLTLFRDITERKRIEKELRESEERYRLIAENMRDLICIIDKDGYFKYSSPSHEKVLGFPSEAYEGSLVFSWMHEEDIPKAQKHIKEMLITKEDCIFQFRYRNTKGDWIWLEAKATPIFDDDGEFKHFHVVSREIMERKMYEEKLTYLAYHDPLTGLPNRRLFQERVEQSLKEAERYGRKMAVMYMDMDKFKHINDTLGHDVGDALLKQFAERVQGCLRESDTLARQGGDEFTILPL